MHYKQRCQQVEKSKGKCEKAPLYKPKCKKIPKKQCNTIYNKRCHTEYKDVTTYRNTRKCVWPPQRPDKPCP